MSTGKVLLWHSSLPVRWLRNSQSISDGCDSAFFGATCVAGAFIAPSFVIVLALAALYVRLGAMPWMQGAFYGIGAVVIAIIARGAQKLIQTLASDGALWLAFAVSAFATAWTESDPCLQVPATPTPADWCEHTPNRYLPQ